MTSTWHWAVSGAAIGFVTLALLWLANRRLGVSTAFEDLCALVSRSPYFARQEIAGAGRWRLWFAAGLVLGGVVSAMLGGGWEAHWRVGMLDAALGMGALGKVVWMFVGGLCVGVGTRLAGGCTSGHGIFGISNLEPASWITTVTFMMAGVATTQLVHRVILGGVGP